jgi:isoleucyl-tRNA synthetase
LLKAVLDGFDAPMFQVGTVTVPIELKVEEKVGKVGVKVDASTFRKACREYAYTQVELQKKDFVRMGVFGDWDNPYHHELQTRSRHCSRAW